MSPRSLPDRTSAWTAACSPTSPSWQISAPDIQKIKPNRPNEMGARCGPEGEHMPAGTCTGRVVVITGAGILRDRMIVTMSEQDWDAVIGVHLKGTFAVLHHAAAYWRQRAKEGHANDARVINTTSPSGLFGNPGQGNYGAAKAGIASLTIIAARELDRYGVTVNAIAPTALTRMTEDIEMMRAAADTADLSPEAISPLVVWLGSAESREVTGRVFGVWGNAITVLEGWVNGPSVSRDTRWDPAGLSAVVPGLVAKAAPNADTMGHRKPAS